VPKSEYLARRWRGFYLPPEPPRSNPLWGVASAALHLVAIAVLVSVTLHPAVPPDAEVPSATIITLLPPGMTGPRQFAMPALGGGNLGGGGGTPGPGDEPAQRPAPGARADTVIPPPEEDVAVVIGDEAGAGDSSAIPGLIGPRRLLRPEYADGRLWVRAWEAGLGVVGPSGSIELHVARVDSAIRAQLQAFIDTMPRDSFAMPPPTDWTTTIGEDTWGIDGSWIYLGDIKIPSILLALLPLPQGNIEAAMNEAELAAIRADILSAANRAETSTEFRDYIEQTRVRKQAERDRKRAERERDDSTRARRDTITP
jgi:hypothetical protein